MDRLETELDGQATILRVDFLGTIGRKLAVKYRVVLIPTLLIFDGNGRLITKMTGLPDTRTILHIMTRLNEA